MPRFLSSVCLCILSIQVAFQVLQVEANPRSRVSRYTLSQSKTNYDIGKILQKFLLFEISNRSSIVVNYSHFVPILNHKRKIISGDEGFKSRRHENEWLFLRTFWHKSFWVAGRGVWWMGCNGAKEKKYFRRISAY